MRELYKILFVGILIGCCFMLVSCTGNWDSYPSREGDPSTQQKEIIETDDILSVSVFDESALSGDYIVLRDGSIQIPLIGNVPVRGKTLDQAARVIEVAMKQQGYLVNPKVSLSLSQESKTVRIMGEVLKTGEYKYKDGMTILAVVADAGGFSYRAHQDNFDIIRKNGDKEIMIKGSISTLLMPGDIIRVKERFF